MEYTTTISLYLFKPKIIVYEKNKTLSLDEGFGIQLAVNSVSILNKIGFNNIQPEKIYHPKKVNFYSMDNNKICELELTKFNNEKTIFNNFGSGFVVEWECLCRQPLH